MAVKRRLIECECGEIFTDSRTTLDGNVKRGPWLFKSHRIRETKAKDGGDILVASWDRAVECAKCGEELMHEKRQYELTPPSNPQKPEPVPSYSSRELVVRAEDLPKNILRMGLGDR